MSIGQGLSTSRSGDASADYGTMRSSGASEARIFSVAHCDELPPVLLNVESLVDRFKSGAAIRPVLHAPNLVAVNSIAVDLQALLAFDLHKGDTF